MSDLELQAMTDLAADRFRQIEQLQARNKELEEWVILRCNELGDQIVKRDKTIEQLQDLLQDAKSIYSEASVFNTEDGLSAHAWETKRRLLAPPEEKDDG